MFNENLLNWKCAYSNVHFWLHLPGVALRLQVEGHVQPGEAALLWGTGQVEQAAPGALPWLQIQTPTQADLHCGGTKAESGRVQGHDEEPAAGAASDLHTQVHPNTHIESTHPVNMPLRVQLNDYSLSVWFVIIIIKCFFDNILETRLC